MVINMRSNRRTPSKRNSKRTPTKSNNTRYYILMVFFFSLAVAIGFLMDLFSNDAEEVPDNTETVIQQPAVIIEDPAPAEPVDDQTDDLEEDSLIEATPEIRIPIPNPHAVVGTRPIEDFGLETAMMLNGELIETYSRENPIDFGDSNHYSDVEGILTFRGNNFRDTAAYGSIGSSITGNLEIVWQTPIPELFQNPNTGATWFGMGWTGQPLIAKWSAETRANMNLFDSKKDKSDLKEVIFGTMGASIYFLDLDDGTPTRPKVNERWILKGSGALDPRGYPLFYVGSGDVSPAGPGQNLIYSLIDTTELFNYGEHDRFRDRGWQAFDGSTIVHAPTDSITYPSETNIIYQFTLNSVYDPHEGTMTIEPSDMFKWKYSLTSLREAYGESMGLASTFEPQYGFESSAVFWREYMYIASNSGHVFCINVNTFEVIWISETYDDTDATPVLELDHSQGRAYLYVGNSAYFSRDPNTEIAHVSFFKLDAVTGEKVWTSEGRPCLRLGESGGIKATAALGRHGLRDLIFVPYANVANANGRTMGSFLVAYDKATGQEVWSENFGGQCWSSPVAVYDDNGKGYIVFGSAIFTNSAGERTGGFVHLLDGLTGERLARVEVPGQMEASPVVYDDMIVIGSRAQMVYGIRIP